MERRPAEFLVTPFHVGVGSNISPEENVVDALAQLQRTVDVTAVSPFYWSAAVGPNGQKSGQSPFLNGVFVCQSAMDATTFKFNVLRPVEAALGRVRTADKFADRALDLDILLWGSHIVEGGALRIPDPDIWKRPFVALPLFDVTGNIQLPGDDRCLKDVLDALDISGMRRDDLVTERLQRELERKG